MNLPDKIRQEGISLVVPLYNEEETIADLAIKLDSFFAKIFNKYEILLIESGSTDNSPKICDELAKKYNHVRTIHEEKKNGYGSGVRLGLNNAKYNLLTYIDSDSPSNLEDYLKAINLLANCDLVLGYRVGKRENFSRWFFSKGYNYLTKVLFGLYDIKDVNFTFKIFRKDIYKKIKLKSNGWFIDVEILSEFRKQKAKIRQMPVNYILRSKGKSTVTINYSLIKGFLREIYEYKFR